jgi:parallel beta-helix repeat protein
MGGTIPLLFIVFGFCPHLYGRVIYVDDDATGTNNGLSWENAYIYLQDALADANNSDKPVEIRVAQGIYRPDLGEGIVPGDREAAFELINQVTVAGGYAGIATNDPNTRDIELYETILSGDLNGDDVEVTIRDFGWITTRADNSYHVLVGSGTNTTAVLDGCIVTGGAANGPQLDGDVYGLGSGGGMYNYQGSPTLTNCTISGNMAGGGGGMYNYMSNVTLANCTFSDNGSWVAGGIWNQKSSVTLKDCTFSRNSDGAMWNDGSSITLTNCTFSDNFRGVTNSMGSIALTHCTFSGNYGGVICYHGWDDSDSGPFFTNCTLSGNYGGVISYNGWDDDPNNDPGPSLTNCILWNNTPNEIPENSIVTYSNIQGDWEGDGNIDEDPLFANPGYWAHVNDTSIVVEPNDPNAVWMDGDYHLKSQAGRFDPTTQCWVEDDVTSPCIDTGDPFSPVMYEPYPRGCVINMGAYGGTEEASKSPSGCSYEADRD